MSSKGKLMSREYQIMQQHIQQRMAKAERERIKKEANRAKQQSQNKGWAFGAERANQAEKATGCLNLLEKRQHSVYP